MTINETRLLDTYVGISNGLDIISEIEGRRVFWNYHRSFDNYRPVCSYSDATFIGVHSHGFCNNLIEIPMCKKNRNHPTVTKILAAFDEIFADDEPEIDTKPAQHTNMVDYAAALLGQGGKYNV